MSHTVHPYSHRLGIIRDWKSRWFSGDKKYKEFLRADILVREFLEKRLRGGFIAGVDLERSQKTFRIVIKTSRPGMIIGKSGEGATKLKQDIIKLLAKEKALTTQEVKLDIEEIRSPE